LERAIEQSDVEHEYAGALMRTIESLFYWPRGNPSIHGNKFLRLRRTRRILTDWAKMQFKIGHHALARRQMMVRES
jgi:hypothetical protein